MKTKRFLALLLSAIMLLGLIPTTVFSYWEEPTAEGNTDLETTVNDYTLPVGVTMQRLTGNSVAEFGEDGNLGDDFLFVIKSGDRYYAMKDVAASETAYSSIPAVDVTDWINADGSLTVPADTLGVAFTRYEERYDHELGMFINGREDYLTYTYDYESVDGDDNDYNDAERIYSGEFKIGTFENGQYIFNPGYWSENGVSGTMQFGGTWSYKISSYNYLYLKYELIVALRNDALGGKEFYFQYLGTDVEYVGDEVEGYLYYAKCRHQGTIRHAEYDAPTCMLKGCEEYWYCENCNRYAKDENFTEFFGEEMPIIPATGHDFDNEKCKNCDRPVPVYSKVTNQAQFDALADDTMFILVAEYNGKYYVLDFSEVYSYMTDSDGNGYYDIHDVDENHNDIPDYLEFDEGGGGDWRDEPNGVYDYLEWDMDDDGDIDDYDLFEFHLMICEQHLTDMLYSNSGINATEIAMNPDGTFSHEEAKKTAEFEMVDVYLLEEFGEDIPEDWENGEMPYHTKCVKQFVIPNYFITAPSMRPVERMYQQRIYDAGDSSSWGVIFYDNRADYYYYLDGDIEQKTSPLPFLDINKEGSVAVFDTFDDIMWCYYDEGQLAQLRLRDYNGTISFVTGHAWELDGWEWIDDESYEDGGYYDTHDTQACVYLYASAQYEAAHTCDFGDWEDDDVTDTHTRKCTVEGCNKKQTENHNWDNGVQTEAPTCTEPGTTTYTCPDCKATKTEPIPALDHDWSEWTYDGVDSHIRHCKRENCDAEDFGGHEWGDWVSVDENTHKMTCSICNGYQTDEHHWDNGIVTKEPTEQEEGVKTYTCTVCSHTKTESIDQLEHIHNYDSWTPVDGTTHSQSCSCGDTKTESHDLQNEVINWETCEYPGQSREWCEICGYENYITRPALGHVWDNGVVTAMPTTEAPGTKTYTCSVCQATRTEELPRCITEIENNTVDIVVNIPNNSAAYIPEGTVIDVVDVPTNEIPQQVLGEIELASKGSVKPLACYDLALLLENAEIQPNGTIQITLPALQQEFDADNVMVVYIAPDGSYQECKTTVNEDGTITFETDHFSRYAVIEITNSTPAIVWILISTISVVLIAGAVVAVIFIKKKKGIA